MRTIAPVTPVTPPVRLVTALADFIDLSDDAYRAIYERLTAGLRARAVGDLLGPGVSFAWWNQYANWHKTLDHDRRNDLRRAAGLPLLPPTPAQALATVHPDAAIWRLGNDQPNRVIMVGGDVADVVLRVNGRLDVLTPDMPRALGLESAVTPVTRPSKRRRRQSLYLQQPTKAAFTAARLRAGMTVDAFLRDLLRRAGIEVAA